MHKYVNTDFYENPERHFDGTFDTPRELRRSESNYLFTVIAYLNVHMHRHPEAYSVNTSSKIKI